jgi:hypothetical protein
MGPQVIVVCLVSALVSGQVVSSQPPPVTMTKLVIHLQSPNVPEADFAVQPKTIYRAGNRYCRIEEVPDMEHDIHGVVVINEPDTWLVNLATKRAEHQLDHGPTFNCRLPVFVSGEDIKSAVDVRSQLMGLEFGRELAYFEERGAIPESGPILKGKTTTVYTVGIGDSQLLLFTSGNPEKPVAVARQRGTKREVYWYETYEEVSFDPQLFAKPEGIKIEEAK